VESPARHSGMFLAGIQKNKRLDSGHRYEGTINRCTT
jgi:hypothetical protein